MKTKRLFLKLFLAVCFLMAVPAGKAEAAQSMDISVGDILVDRTKIKQGNNLTEGSIIEDSDTAAESLTDIAYTISGTASSPRKIIIKDLNTTNKNALYLNFNNLSALSDLQLIINNANVYITVQGINNSLKSSGNHAVTITNGQLHLSGSNSCITITGGSTGSSGGASAAVHAENNSSFIVDSGRVVLIAGGGSNTSNVPFNGGGLLSINDGTLECLKNGNYTNYGNGNFSQTGGIVKSEGLARINMSEEKIEGLTHDNYNFSLQSSTGGQYNIGEISHPSGGIEIQNGWLGQNMIIEPSSSSTTMNSVRQILYIPNRRTPSPSGFTATPETVSGGDDGTIARVNNTMEYAEDKGTSKDNYKPSDWKSSNFSNNTFTNVKPGTYRVRYKYVEADNPTDSLFASLPSTQTVTVGRATPLTASLENRPHVFASKDFGYEEKDLPTAASIIIQNSDIQGGATITSITVDNEDAFEIIPGNDIPKAEPNSPARDTSWQIRPKTGLNAGDYKATITINYKNRLDADQEPIVIEDAVEFTVKKLPYEGDNLEVAPEFDSASFNSITLKPIEIEGNKKEFEYSKDNGKTWQKELTFTDLEADTEYKFVARYASTTNHEASEPGPTSKEFKTEKKASIVYSTKQLSLIPNRKYQISIDGNSENFDECTIGANGLLDIKDKWFGKTISLYDTDKKNTQTLNIPDISKAPTSPKGQAESFSSAGDGKILGVTTSMEYKLKGSDDDWVTCPAKTIENLPAGTYLVRTKAVDEGTGENKKYTFASHATEVVIARGNALSISPETFDLGKSPYKVLPAAKAIAFRNHDKTEDITIKSIALSDESPFAILHKETDSAIVPAGKNNETFKIQPKPDLNVGTYTDEFVVTFEVGYNPDTSTGDNQIQAQAEGFNTDSPDTSGEKSASIPITFTVEKGTQEAPPVPAEKSVKSTSITLETIPNSTVSGAKAQYSKDGGKTWQDSPTFNKLKADTEYYFVSRYAATDNYNESEISNGENAITTEEKDADKDDDDNSGNKNVSSNANGSTGSNGINCSGTYGSGTTGNNGNGTTGTNGTGTNGTNSGSGSNSSRLASARTGDLNNIQLWVALMIGSYLSSYLIIKDRIKKAKVK